MKKFTGFIVVLPVLLALTVGCSVDDPADPTGQVNEPGLQDAGTRYAAIGNSLTAGVMDGGLMQAGQVNSFPRLIATQLGMAEFDQPMVLAPGIGGSDASDADHTAGVLRFDGAGLTLLGETLTDDLASILPAATVPTPYHNLGVPGATLVDGMNAYDPYSSAPVGTAAFKFINRAEFFGNEEVQSGYPGPSGLVPVTYQSGSMFWQAIAKGPALATVWLGNNDVLGPATSGNPPAGFGPAGQADFQAEFTALIAMMAGGLAQRNGLTPTLAVANIPDITSIPYFIPEVVFDAYVQSQLGGSWPGGYEETITPADYVLFPALSWLTEDGRQMSDAIPSHLTLTTAEATDVATAVAIYNQIIDGVVTEVNDSGTAKVGLVNANTELANLPTPQKTHFLFLLGQGLDVPTAAATTYFSLDGIHPNNVGYGYIANLFIDKINELDGTSIPAVDLAGLSWDPTYEDYVTSKSEATDGLVSPAAARAMAAFFR